MTLPVIFLLTAVAGCVWAAVDGLNVQDGSYTALLDRIDRLEDMVKMQAQLIETMASERQQWLADKQSLQISVQHLKALCFSADATVQRDGTGNKNEATGQSLELAKETKASPTHKHFGRSDDSDPLVAVVTQLTEKVNEVSASQQTLKDEVSGGLLALKNQVNAGLQALREEVRAGHRELKSEVTEASTSLFVRWGSSRCPESAVLVYSGEVGGSSYIHTGAAANYLCLPVSNVTLMDISVNNFAQLFGGEYETVDEHNDKDPVCAVCRSSRATNVMIPATTVCPPGWTSEYSGWLMAGNPGHNAASEFICVDSVMEERIGSDQNLNGKLMYYTATVCGSLPCPPYVNGMRVTCVVCSK